MVPFGGNTPGFRASNYSSVVKKHTQADGNRGAQQLSTVERVLFATDKESIHSPIAELCGAFVVVVVVSPKRLKIVFIKEPIVS